MVLDTTIFLCRNYTKTAYLITVCYATAQNFKYLKFYNHKFYKCVACNRILNCIATDGFTTSQLLLVIKFHNTGIFLQPSWRARPARIEKYLRCTYFSPHYLHIFKQKQRCPQKWTTHNRRACVSVHKSGQRITVACA